MASSTGRQTAISLTPPPRPRLRLQAGPTVVVGHSYGGQIITALGADAERQFAKRMGAITVEVPVGRAAMVSHPDDVAQLIKTAAEAVQTAH